MFYEQLIKLCARSGITPFLLMRHLNVNTDCLRRWEKGGPVNSDVLLKLSEFFGVSVDYLLKGDRGEKGFKLSDREKEFILKFRMLNTMDKGRVLERMEVFIENERESLDERNTRTNLITEKTDETANSDDVKLTEDD